MRAFVVVLFILQGLNIFFEISYLIIEDRANLTTREQFIRARPHLIRLVFSFAVAAWAFILLTR
jgi:hypothetical protein